MLNLNLSNITIQNIRKNRISFRKAFWFLVLVTQFLLASFSVSSQEITNEPVISYISGSGPYPIGTREAEIVISSDVGAKCKASLVDSDNLSDWKKYLTTDDNRTHRIRAKLFSDENTTRYIRCRNLATAEINSTSFNFPIYFSQPSVISTPQNFQVDRPNSADGEFTLNWDVVSSAVRYRLMEQGLDGLWSEISLNGLPLSIDMSRPESGDYQYKIAACSDLTDENCSAFTSPITVWVGAMQSGDAPVISYVSGSGPHPNSVDKIEMIVATDINAICRGNYLDTGDFSDWNKNLSTEDNRLHRIWVPISGAGNTEKYVRCQSLETSATNQTSFVFPITVAESSDLPIPDNFRVDTTPNTGNYLLEWNAVDNAVSYLLKETQDGENWTRIVVPASELELSLAKTEDADYQYYLMACDDELGLECGKCSAALSVVVVGSNDNNLAPVINSQPLLSGTESVAYVYDVNAIDPNSTDTITYSLINPPQDMTILSDTGEISWTPTSVQVSTYTIEVRATDNEGLFDTQSYSLVIAASNQAPEFTSIAVTEATEGLTYNYTLTASDPNAGDTLTFSLSQFPQGMSLDPNTNLISWVPSSDQVATHVVVALLTDSAGLTDSQEYDLTVANVNNAPEFTSAPITSAQELESYTYQLTATDQDDDVLTFELVTKPPGMDLSVDGLITWTPGIAQEGEHDVSLTVTDPSGLSDTQNYIVIVGRRSNTTAIAEPQSLTSAEDFILNITLTATDVDSNQLTYEVITQPTNGVLTGTVPNLIYTPNTNFFGSDVFTFKANDGVEDSNTASINLSIAAVNDAPIANPLELNLNEDGTVNITLTGSDIENDILTYSVVASPTNGVLTGTAPNLVYTPNADFNGEDSFSFMVNDGGLDSVAASVNLIVSAVNDAPVIDSTPVNYVFKGNEWSYQILASDVDGDNLTVSMTGSADGAVFDPLTNQVSWSTDGFVLGEYEFSFDVVDGQGASVSQSVLVAVLPKDRAVTHEGTEFWLASTKNNKITDSILHIFFVTTHDDVDVQIEIPILDVSTSISLTPNSIASYEVRGEDIDEVGGYDVDKILENNAIHITSNKNITVYALNQVEYSTDGLLALPVRALGKNYIVSHFNYLNYIKTPVITFVATEDNTSININASMDMFFGEKDNVDSYNQVNTGDIFSIEMNAGDVFNLEARGSDIADLTGSIITADKGIVVLGQHGCAFVPVGAQACDHLLEQLPPIESLGVQYFTAPFWGRGCGFKLGCGDAFRIIAPFDDTDIYINGVLEARLQKKEYFEFFSDESQEIKSSHPTLLIQYSTGSDFDSRDDTRPLEPNKTDPFMVVVPPSEQFLSSYTINTPTQEIELNFVNIIIPDSAISSISIDNESIDVAEFIPFGNEGFSYAQLEISTGTHQLNADLPFGVYIYGNDTFESYGYLGGMAFSLPNEVETLQITAESEIDVGDTLCLNALALDSSNRPLNGVRIKFSVEGEIDTFGYSMTGRDGMAEYCYQQYEIGNDIVTSQVGIIAEVVNVTWQASNNDIPLVITSLPTLKVEEETNYSYQIETTEQVGNLLIYSKLEGPDDLTVSQDGLVEWNDVVFSYADYDKEKVTIKIEDANGLSVEQKFTLRKFVAFNTSSTFDFDSHATTGVVGVPYVYNTEYIDFRLDGYKYEVNTTDIDNDGPDLTIVGAPDNAYIELLEIGDLGKSCVSCNRYLRWTPESEGNYQFEMHLRDARGATTPEIQTFDVNVVENTPPKIISNNPPTTQGKIIIN